MHIIPQKVLVIYPSHLSKVKSRKKYPFRIPSINKWYPFHIPRLGLCIPFNCYKCIVISTGINYTNRTLSRLYKATKFICSAL